MSSLPSTVRKIQLLGGMIDDPPEEPPSPVLIESLMPRKEWAEDLCDSVKTMAT